MNAQPPRSWGEPGDGAIYIRTLLRVLSDDLLQWQIQTHSGTPKGSWRPKRYCRTKLGLLSVLRWRPFGCTDKELEPLKSLPDYHPDFRKRNEDGTLEESDD